LTAKPGQPHAAHRRLRPAPPARRLFPAPTPPPPARPPKKPPSPSRCACRCSTVAARLDEFTCNGRTNTVTNLLVRPKALYLPILGLPIHSTRTPRRAFVLLYHLECALICVAFQRKKTAQASRTGWLPGQAFADIALPPTAAAPAAAPKVPIPRCQLVLRYIKKPGADRAQTAPLGPYSGLQRLAAGRDPPGGLAPRPGARSGKVASPAQPGRLRKGSRDPLRSRAARVQHLGSLRAPLRAGRCTAAARGIAPPPPQKTVSLFESAPARRRSGGRCRAPGGLS
jgi:hypothetical protein